MVLLCLADHHVLFHRGDELRILAEIFLYLLVRLDAERADEDSNRYLAVLIDSDVEDVVRVGLIFEPRAAVRDNGRGKDDLAGLVDRGFVVYSGRADDLRDDDTLGTVDDKRAVVGHEREIAHKDGRLLDLAGRLVSQPDCDTQRSGEVRVTLFALLLGVLRRRVDGIVDEFDYEVARVIGDRGHVAQHLAQSLI